MAARQRGAAAAAQRARGRLVLAKDDGLLEPSDGVEVARELERLGRREVEVARDDDEDDRVVALLGEQSPPFPEGNTVDPGDLTLLDPVKAGGRRYRDA